MKKLLIAVVVVAGLSAAVVLFSPQREAEDGPLTLYGNIDIREVAPAFRQGGRVAAVVVEEGDTVERGELLAHLDEEPFQEALAAAEARLAVARARVRLLEQGSRPQEIEQARAQVQQGEAQLRAAERDLERKAGLLQAGATSSREVDGARERRDVAAAQVASAREALKLAEAGFRDEELAAGRAEMRLAAAEVEQVRTALADTRLLAPSPGTVVTRAWEPGSIVSAGTPIVTLSLREPVVVRAYVSEPSLGVVAPGTPVEITTDSASRVYRGRVGFVSPRAEFTPKTVQTPELRTDLVYRLRIVVEDPDRALRQGMPVTVQVQG